MSILAETEFPEVYSLIEKDRFLRLYNPETNEFLKSTEEVADENQGLKAELEGLKTLLREKSRKIL